MNKFLTIVFMLFWALNAHALSISNLYGSGMVMQQNASVTLWGWGHPGEKISVKTSWGEQTTTVVGANSNWKTIIKTQEGGFNPESVTVTGSKSKIVLKDILIGEVWLAAGQDNITATFKDSVNLSNPIFQKEEYKKGLRFFTVDKRPSMFSHEDIKGQWTGTSESNLLETSILAYYFAFQIKGFTQIPVGVVIQDWGHEPIDSWHTETAMDEELAMVNKLEEIKNQPFTPHHEDIAHHAMMYQFRNYKIAGVLWSHGKHEIIKKNDYKDSMLKLIKNMRNQFGEVPFYYVQIAPYKYGNITAGAKIRDQQREILSIKKTAMVVTSDISHHNDFNPQNKDDIGVRLANIALKRIYKKINDEVVESPNMMFIQRKGRTLYVHFSNSKGLHFAKGDRGNFEVCSEDGIYHPVPALIHKNIVELDLKGIKKPQFVRFGWNSKARPFLENEVGLPASCFSKQKIIEGDTFF
ncbi:sialate O-acetylesterase [Flammeovirga kamogawensis]|uniref:Sialate O-acetylesterase domain-containing protein n=1 Tax=Flammeovirga kamogawensis TaxID=373891 RepID=A0ABX8H0Z1_9BACT|nr:sialate O-acetylesterase [Flammeovirga kamogawensis]MBB6463301.1 sialate O-acetylesterase [Flammeovirga kamogawensis]QWG09549.1 hypothetical protein KM029_23360 [Flammeovirga kamogawensis]TRX65063.1 sialate O-acetylesterase [Flammeovirga kamogawensis]